MYKILKAEKLADKIFLMDVHAPRVASHCQPGQFVIVKMDEKGERIPRDQERHHSGSGASAAADGAGTMIRRSKTTVFYTDRRQL